MNTRTPQPGGTRFIGLYLARQLVQEGHHVTLFTRGKKEVTSEIPDDTPEGFKVLRARVRAFACCALSPLPQTTLPWAAPD